MAHRALIWVRNAAQALYLRRGVLVREVLLAAEPLPHHPGEAVEKLHRTAQGLDSGAMLMPHDSRAADGDAGRFRVTRAGRVYHEPGTGDGWWDPWREVPIEPVDRVRRGAA